MQLFYIANMNLTHPVPCVVYYSFVVISQLHHEHYANVTSNLFDQITLTATFIVFVIIAVVGVVSLRFRKIVVILIRYFCFDDDDCYANIFYNFIINHHCFLFSETVYNEKFCMS